jgi:hypothetical protein
LFQELKVEIGDQHQTQVNYHDHKHFTGTNHVDLILQNYEQGLIKKHGSIDQETKIKTIQNELFLVLVICDHKNIVNGHQQLCKVNQAEKQEVVSLLLSQEPDEDLQVLQVFGCGTAECWKHWLEHLDVLNHLKQLKLTIQLITIKLRV